MPQTQEVRLPAVVNERLLMVPDYQRPFAWGPKQLSDLWEDLDLLGPGGSHYAGTLVLMDVPGSAGTLTSEEDDGTVLRHVEVVDGQQRLTTCLLLLDRIRRKLETLVDDLEDAGTVALTLRQRYGVAIIDGVKVPRLRMGNDLNDYWLSVILGDEVYVGPPLIAGQRRLRDAATFFDDKLTALMSGCSPSEQLHRLRELQKRVTSGLGFLVYEVASVAEVGMIFETLNERGRQLTDLEKTKNYLLYLARTIPGAQGDDLASKINHAWSAIFTNLAKEPEGTDDQLLRAHWLATQDPNTREWKRIASIKARFDRSLYVSGETRLIPVHKAGADQAQAWEQLYQDVSRYITSLRSCSFFMAEMFDEHGAFEAFGSEDVRDRVRLRSAALRRSGVIAIWRPLLFSSRLAHPTDGQLYADLVDMCERYSARVFVIEQRRANAGEGRLLRLAYELHNGKESSAILKDMHDVLWTYGPDSQVLATIQSTSENWYGRRGHKYLLYEYEVSLMRPKKNFPRCRGSLRQARSNAPPSISCLRIPTRMHLAGGQSSPRKNTMASVIHWATSH